MCVSIIDNSKHNIARYITQQKELGKAALAKLQSHNKAIKNKKGNWYPKCKTEISPFKYLFIYMYTVLFGSFLLSNHS